MRGRRRMCEKNGIQVIEAEGFQDHERLEALSHCTLSCPIGERSCTESGIDITDRR
jgi:hypothetical protein